MPTRKCRNFSLRVKIGFSLWSTLKCTIGTKFGAAPLLEGYAKVAKLSGNSSNPSMLTRKCLKVTLGVKIGFGFLEQFKVSDRHKKFGANSAFGKTAITS